MTADEARELAADYRQRNFAMEQYLQDIRESASQGGEKIQVFDIGAYEQQKLIDLGYKVEMTSQYECDGLVYSQTFEVSW